LKEVRKEIRERKIKLVEDVERFEELLSKEDAMRLKYSRGRV